MSKLSVSAKYYLTGFLVIIVVPVIILALYEWLAGGILNGIAGSWREAIINPDILLLFINPVLLLLSYSLLIYFFRQYMRGTVTSIGKIPAVIAFGLATIVVLTGVFWKMLTT